jgi:tetratricopeptide (TPR) repeat protein
MSDQGEAVVTNLTKLTILTAVLTASAAATVFLRGDQFSETEQGNRALREASLTSALDRRISELQADTATHPEDTSALTELGFAYLQKARETGDPTLYSRAEGAFNQGLARTPGDAQVLTGLGAVALARHEFQKALDLGRSALAIDPEDADAHAVNGDALIELGRYSEAIDAFQRVVDIRPDLGAFVRIAYIRELHGDVEGARRALEDAVEAGGPRGESAAYARVQLGNLLFGLGELPAAERQYETSLEALPGYVHGLAGLARVAGARGEYDEAMELYEEVTGRQPVFEYVAALGDIYAAAGRGEEAERQYALVAAIEQLYRAGGVNTDLESAVFLADRGIRLDEAVTQARAIYGSQPGSIRAADALAWTLHRAGRSAEALQYARQALRLGTRDNNLLFHTAMVERAAGDPARARLLLEQVLARNPRFLLLYAEQAVDTLDELNTLAEAR